MSDVGIIIVFFLGVFYIFGVCYWLSRKKISVTNGKIQSLIFLSAMSFLTIPILLDSDLDLKTRVIVILASASVGFLNLYGLNKLRRSTHKSEL